MSEIAEWAAFCASANYNYAFTHSAHMQTKHVVPNEPSLEDTPYIYAAACMQLKRIRGE